MSATPTRSVCGHCHQIIRVDFQVSDDTWQQVVADRFLHTIHCLNCFTLRADEKGVQWDTDPELEFFPRSFVTHRQKVKGWGL